MQDLEMNLNMFFFVCAEFEEKLNSASVLKNNPEVDETIKLIGTRFA